MKLWHGIVVMTFVVIGFAQERLKVSLNYYLDITASSTGFYDLPPDRRDAWLNDRKVNAPYDYYYNHDRIGWYNNFSRKELTALKWGYALVFILVHASLSGAVIVKWYKAKLWPLKKIKHSKAELKSLRYLLLLYAGAAILALLFFVIIRVGVNPEASYAVARKLLGFMQSPFPLIIVLFTDRLQRAFT